MFVSIQEIYQVGLQAQNQKNPSGHLQNRDGRIQHDGLYAAELEDSAVIEG